MHSMVCREATKIFFVAVFISGSILSSAPLAYASTNVVVRQVLPPKAQTCPSLSISDIHAYIYNDSLHSFDISISDASFVAIDGQVGNTPISFAQMTRWRNADGSLRIHVDTQTIALRQSLSIRIVLLSAHTGTQQVTCIAVISGSIPSVVSGAGKSVVGGGIHTTPQQGYTSGKVSHESTGQGVPTVTPLTANSSLGNTCKTSGGAAGLWVVLIVLYTAFVGALALQKDKKEYVSYISQEWNIVLILAIFVALLLFWYLSASCRTTSWAPVLTTLVACIGLILMGYDEGNKEKKIPLLKDPNPKQMPLLKTKSGVKEDGAL